MKGRWSRVAPLTGLPFVGLLVAAFIIGGNTPDTDWSPQRVVSFYEAHRTAQIAAAILLAYGVLFVLLFGAALRAHLRARSSSDGVIALGFAGVIVFGIGVLTFSGFGLAAADVPGKIDPAAEQALSVLANDTFIAFLLGMAVFMFGNGLAIVRTGVLPKWLGWVAVVIGIVAVTPVGWFGLFGMLAWTLVVSVLMFMREGKAAAPPAAATAPAV